MVKTANYHLPVSACQWSEKNVL